MKTIQGVTIGDKFIQRGKGNSVATVVDIYTVTNSKGKIVRYECIATSNVIGQKVLFEVPFASVVRGIIKEIKMKKAELRQIIKEEIQNVLTEDIKSDATKFIKSLNQKYNKDPKGEHFSYTFDGKFGSKFVKILAKPIIGAGLSAWGFIALQDQSNKGIKVGDLMKAASWNAPAKHARGNILTGTANYDRYGPAYLK